MLNQEAGEDERARWMKFLLVFVIVGIVIGLGPDMMSFLTGLDINNIQTCQNIQQQTNCMPSSLKTTLMNMMFIARIIGAITAIAGGGWFAVRL